MAITDLAYASATAIASAVRSGEITALEVTTAAIQRIQRLDPLINAVVVRDFERALRDAKHIDERRLRGREQPMTPALRYDRDLTVIGPMARHSEDLELVLGLLTIQDPLVPPGVLQTLLPPPRHRRIADFRVLVVDSHPLIPTSGEILGAIDDLSEHLATSGAHVRRSSDLLPDLRDNARLYGRVLMASIAAAYPPARYAAASRDALVTLADADASVFARARAEGIGLSHREWLTTDTARALEREAWRVLFEHFDVVITPVTPTRAFSHDQSADQWKREIEIDGAVYPYPDQLVWAALASASGQPATVVPIGSAQNGLPIGVQLIGPLYEDLTPLALARWLDRTYRDFTAPPIDGRTS